MANYGIEFKFMGNKGIDGFFVVDSSGRQTLISADKTIQLVETGTVENWEVVVDDDGEKHLYSKDLSLKNLPNSIRGNDITIRIVGKLRKENEDAGYLCIDSNGSKRSYTHEKVWELAKLGRITDVKAERFGKNRVLTSKDNMLRDLPIFTIK